MLAFNIMVVYCLWKFVTGWPMPTAGALCHCSVQLPVERWDGEGFVESFLMCTVLVAIWRHLLSFRNWFHQCSVDGKGRENTIFLLHQLLQKSSDESSHSFCWYKPQSVGTWHDSTIKRQWIWCHIAGYRSSLHVFSLLVFWMGAFPGLVFRNYSWSSLREHRVLWGSYRTGAQVWGSHERNKPSSSLSYLPTLLFNLWLILL